MEGDLYPRWMNLTGMDILYGNATTGCEITRHDCVSCQRDAFRLALELDSAC